jgi:hypothetical protein
MYFAEHPTWTIHSPRCPIKFTSNCALHRQISPTWRRKKLAVVSSKGYRKQWKLW